MVESFVEKEWYNVLDLIPIFMKEDWAERHDFIKEEDCDYEEPSLEDFTDDEIEEEYFDRKDVGHRIDIILDSQLDELTSSFLAADFKTQELILEQLRK